MLLTISLCSTGVIDIEIAIEALRLHLAASEFAQLEAGYLEGALAAADTAVNSVKSFPPFDI